jgi:hypothetical protein
LYLNITTTQQRSKCPKPFWAKRKKQETLHYLTSKYTTKL